MSALRCGLLALLAAGVAHAQLRIEVTSGVSDPVPIAIVPFAAAADAAPALALAEPASIVQRDLEGSGRFRALARDSIATPAAPGDRLNIEEWRAKGVDYVLLGRVSRVAAAQFAIDFELVATTGGQRLLAERVVFESSIARARNAAHRIADRVYERIVGVRGAFATRVAYVSVDGQPPRQSYQLIVADTDGEGARIALESRLPLMSPAWSPDGEALAYVSFEAGVSAVYVQQLRSGQRSRVSIRAGVNGAPAWSPDGKKLALTLSGSGGNLDIYVLELASQSLTRITDDQGIDTEAAWSPDGAALYFTSDRSGAPQIYRLTPGTGERPQRITFGVAYAGRPRISPDGRQLALVIGEAGSYKIAVQDLASGELRPLTRGRLDESPSFAPNGALLIYAGRERSAGVLATVSVDGLTGQRLKADRGEVREPAWGPFLR